jgi:hypothetical protein
MIQAPEYSPASLGQALALFLNIRLVWKRKAKNKHSSLLDFIHKLEKSIVNKVPDEN